MKKLLLTTLVLSTLFSTSCKKDRTCVCTTTSSCTTCPVTEKDFIVNSTKKKAKKKCEALQSKVVEETETINTVCEIE
jgi:hypothetical protein